MPKKMDPNLKLIREISKLASVVEHYADTDVENEIVTKGGCSALTRIKSLADAINVPSEVAIAAKLADRKARREAEKVAQEKRDAREAKRAAKSSGSNEAPTTEKRAARKR